MKSTREIILERAGALFYRQGFNNTGMDEITRLVGVKKPALYYHFESKNVLGIAYLEYRASLLFTMLEGLAARAKTFDKYLSSWATALIMLGRRGEFFGCPFTAFASEMDGPERDFFRKTLLGVEERWLALQEKAYTKFGGNPSEAKKIAQRILAIHTGYVMLYRASRDERHLRGLKAAFGEIK